MEGHQLRGEEADESDDDGPDAGEALWAEEGEIVPSALRADDQLDDDRPTEPPRGGFPRIHRDDPETATRGMATEWIREIWADPPNSDVLVEVFNYRCSEDDVLNRHIAEVLQWAFEQISGEQGFDVVPPEPADNSSRRSRDRPTIWAIRGLSTRSDARAIARGAWSFRAITFFATPRTVTLPSWLFMLEGFLNGNVNKIRAAVLRVLGEESMWDWIAEMVSENPDFAGMTHSCEIWMRVEDAVSEVLASIRVETFQLTNGNYIANVHVDRSPTRSMREWRRWVAALRARRYPSFTNGTGRVRYIAPCAGCKSVDHLTHLCPYPRTYGWNGPGASEGVFGERRRNDEEHDHESDHQKRSYGGKRSDNGRRNDWRQEGRCEGGQQQSRRGSSNSGSRRGANASRYPNPDPPSHQRGGSSARGKRGPGKGSNNGGNRRF